MSLIVTTIQGILLTILDNAIFTAKFTANLGPKIAGAVLPLGLPASSLPAFIGDLAANNQTDLATVPGVTGQIIGAGVGGLFEAYSIGFRFVWVAAGTFMLLAAICKSILYREIFKTRNADIWVYRCCLLGRPSQGVQYAYRRAGRKGRRYLLLEEISYTF